MDMLDAFFPYALTSEDITVRVSVNFLPEQSDIDRKRWFWAYHIRIENGRDSAVQLLTRHWRITDGHGGIQYVDGEGVVGEQPLLQPGASHDYVSGCPLNTDTGSMEGHFTFLGKDNRTFDAGIPRFSLSIPTVDI